MLYYSLFVIEIAILCFVLGYFVSKRFNKPKPKRKHITRVERKIIKERKQSTQELEDLLKAVNNYEGSTK